MFISPEVTTIIVAFIYHPFKRTYFIVNTSNYDSMEDVLRDPD